MDQAATILLGRLYFNSGGNRVGSPLLAALLLVTPRATAGEPRPAASMTAAVRWNVVG